MANLIEELQSEMNRVRKLIETYKSLPGGVGVFGMAMFNQEVARAEKAIAEGDTIMMMTSLTEMREFE